MRGLTVKASARLMGFPGGGPEGRRQRRPARVWRLAAITIAASLAVPFFSIGGASSSWTVENVDPGEHAEAGRMALSATGGPQVVYWSFWNLSLLYAVRSGASWGHEVLRQPIQPEGYDIAFDAMDRPHVVFVDNATDEIWHLVRDNGTWTEDLVGFTEAFSYSDVSLAFDRSSRPHFVYQDGPQGSRTVRYAYWNGSAWRTETVDSGPYVGAHERIKIALDASDNVITVYSTSGPPPQELRYARRNGTGWDTEVIASNFSIQGSSIAVDWTGTPLVAFGEWNGGSFNGFKFARRVAPGDWSFETVDPGTQVNSGPFIALGP